jgi:hypothetical protein
LPPTGDDRDVFARIGVLFVAAGVAMLFRTRPVRFGLGIATVLAGGLVAFQLRGTLVLARTAYGVSRVVAERGRHLLVHGTTIHGGQEPGPGGRPLPLAYHGPESPLGTLLARPGPAGAASDADFAGAPATTAPATALRQRQDRSPRRVAVVGLGAGALAHYARPGDEMRFYELDPAVAALARDPSCFAFLATCRGAVDVTMGDGRLSLAREPDARFDLIVLDAFTSDAVPVHLVTVEALALYMRKLAPGGLVVFNTSNRHVDLPAVVGALARALALPSRSTPPPARDPDAATHGTWVAIARLPGDLDRWLAADPRWRPTAGGAVRPWTDDHASLADVLRF